jgi:anti-sigma regulatory factor (Ser/Thr protein kinase)
VVDRIDAQPGPAPPGPPGAPAPLRAVPERRVYAWRFPLTNASVPAVRHAVRPFVARAGLPDDEAEDQVLATCEAAANVVDHARASTQAYFDVTFESSGDDVVIMVRDHGRWQAGRTPFGAEGRGLKMMMSLAAVTLTSGPEGTTVTLRSKCSLPS